MPFPLNRVELFVGAAVEQERSLAVARTLTDVRYTQTPLSTTTPFAIWHACDNSVNEFDDNHKARILEVGTTHIVISGYVDDDNNSEIDVAQWSAADTSRPKIYPGLTKALTTHLYSAHRYSYGEDIAELAYAKLQVAVDGIAGFMVYHEPNEDYNARLPLVMDRLRELYLADTSNEPLFWATHVHDATTPPDQDTFFSTYWAYENAIWASYRYCWFSQFGQQVRIETFEDSMYRTADKALELRQTNGWPCKWVGKSAAHAEQRQDEYSQWYDYYYTPDLEEMLFESLLPIALGADGVAYFVFDWMHQICTDDIYRNATTRSNLVAIKARITSLKNQLYPYTYCGYSKNVVSGDWYKFPRADAYFLDRIEESTADKTSWNKIINIAIWKAPQGYECFAITNRDPWTASHSYVAYFKQEAAITWDGVSQGKATQFAFTLSAGDTRVLKLGQAIVD